MTEAVYGYNGEPAEQWLEEQIAIGLGEKPSRYEAPETEEDRPETPTHTPNPTYSPQRGTPEIEAILTKLTGDIGNRDLSSLAQELHTGVWETGHEKTAEAYLRGHLLHPNYLNGLATAHGSVEVPLFYERLHGLIDHIGGEWSEYVPLLENAGFGADGAPIPS